MSDYKHHDFDDIKRRYPIMDLLPVLEIHLKLEGGLRGECPYCGDHRGFRVTPNPKDANWSLAGCFACHRRGINCIQLVMDLRQFHNPRHAADWIVQQLGDRGTSTVPARNSTVPSDRKSTVPDTPPPAPAPATENNLEKIAARLLHEHEDVQALGLSPDMAEHYGVGYDKRGALAGRVCFPLYKDGKVHRYCGYAPDLDPVIKIYFGRDEQEKPTAQVIRLPKAG